MAPIIHCVRHAQGYHNLNVANHTMPDPQLTPFGEEQCRLLAQNFPYHDNVDCVVASPLKRTLRTALLGFGQDLNQNGLKVMALPELQETSDLPCDTGSAQDVLAKEFEGRPVELSLVTPDWNSKRGRWDPLPPAIEARAKEARLWLMARPEKEVVVVTHGWSLLSLAARELLLTVLIFYLQAAFSTSSQKTGLTRHVSAERDGPIPSFDHTPSPKANHLKRT